MRVQGGTVTGFYEGIVLVAPNSRVSGVTVSDSPVAGIDLGDCAGCRVVGNRVSGTTASNGIGILLSGDLSGARVSGNTVTGNAGVGIQVNRGSPGARLTGNVATDNGAVDLRDRNASTAEGCATTWRGNTFETTAGESAACIQ